MTDAIVLAREATRSELTDAEQALVLLSDFKIRNSEDRDYAAEVLCEVKQRHGTLESQRRRITDPLNAALREVNNLFRPVRDALEQCERLLKDRIAAFVVEQEQRNRAALLEAQAASGAEEAGAAIQRMETPELPKGVSVRHQWKFEIVNQSAVPRDLCSPDPRKISAAFVGDIPPDIPGVRWFQERIVAARSR